MTSQINAIPGTHMLTRLKYTLAHRVAVAKIPCFKPPQADSQSGLGLLIAQTVEPFGNRFGFVLYLVTKQFNHRFNCSLKYTNEPGPKSRAQKKPAGEPAGLHVFDGPRARSDQWNCSSSVEPVSAVTLDLPP